MKGINSMIVLTNYNSNRDIVANTSKDITDLIHETIVGLANQNYDTNPDGSIKSYRILVHYIDNLSEIMTSYIHFNVLGMFNSASNVLSFWINIKRGLDQKTTSVHFRTTVNLDNLLLLSTYETCLDLFTTEYGKLTESKEKGTNE